MSYRLECETRSQVTAASWSRWTPQDVVDTRRSVLRRSIKPKGIIDDEHNGPPDFPPRPLTLCYFLHLRLWNRSNTITHVSIAPSYIVPYTAQEFQMRNQDEGRVCRVVGRVLPHSASSQPQVNEVTLHKEAYQAPALRLAMQINLLLSSAIPLPVVSDGVLLESGVPYRNVIYDAISLSVFDSAAFNRVSFRRRVLRSLLPPLHPRPEIMAFTGDWIPFLLRKTTSDFLSETNRGRLLNLSLHFDSETPSLIEPRAPSSICRQ